MTDKKLRITIMGTETVELIEKLCTSTGLNAPSLVALLVRKYGKDLETWLDYTPAPPTPAPPPLVFPTNPGEGLSPIEL